MATAAGLDGGLLVRADHVFPPAQPSSLENAGVEVQHHRCLGCKDRVSGEDPRPVLPGFDGVRSQGPPDRGRRYERHHASDDQLPSQFCAAPARQRHAGGGRQLACQGFDLDVDRGGKRPGAFHSSERPPDLSNPARRTASASGAPPAGWYRAGPLSRRSPVHRRPTTRSWLARPARKAPCSNENGAPVPAARLRSR